MTVDHRGWKKGVPRIHPEDLRERIVSIRQQLVKDKNEFYIGDLAVGQKYATLYPNDPVPDTHYIGEILHDEGLTVPHHKKRRGVARYLAYPVECVKRLGERIAETDFIGHKFIQGVGSPVHFLSVAYQQPARLRCIYRVDSETTVVAIGRSRQIFDECGWPDVVRVDAGLPFTGRGERSDQKGARSIPSYAVFLLKERITPVFGAIRSPWNQAYVEGSNSVFGRNFWGSQTFTSLAQIDERLNAFNRCSKNYAQWKPWSRSRPQSFVPRICFIRKVEEDARKKHGVIAIASTWVSLPKSYIGLFIFGEWNLHHEQLHIYFERNQIIQEVKVLSFPIHPASKERCTGFIA